jgi:hypothetical protein
MLPDRRETDRVRVPSGIPSRELVAISSLDEFEAIGWPIWKGFTRSRPRADDHRARPIWRPPPPVAEAHGRTSRSKEPSMERLRSLVDVPGAVPRETWRRAWSPMDLPLAACGGGWLQECLIRVGANPQPGRKNVEHRIITRTTASGP